MSKYIDADKLEKDGWSMHRVRQVSPTETVYETKKLTEFPAADVAEMRRGRWIFETLDGTPGYRPTVMFCSKCGRVSIADYNYCPNCGANMINDDEEMSKVSEMEMTYGEYLND